MLSVINFNPLTPFPSISAGKSKADYTIIEKQFFFFFGDIDNKQFLSQTKMFFEKSKKVDGK